MSFLAQLRQQQANSSTGLQLCYLLQTKAQNQISLGLYLATLTKGELSGNRQAYRVQRQHLVMPPPFLAPADATVLAELIQHDERWLNGHEHALLEAACHSMLHSLVATGKCFAQEREGVWRKLEWGPTQSIRPYWAVQGDGYQHVKWTSADTIAALHSPNRPDLRVWRSGEGYWIFSPDKKLLSPTQPAVDESARALVTSQTRLSFADVEPFLSSQGPLWRQHGLPLPEALAQVTLDSEVRPLLILRTGTDAQGHGRDELCLAFRYTSDRLCMVKGAGIKERAQRIWSGEELLMLPTDSEKEQQWQEKLSRFIERFMPTDEAGVWTSKDKQHWQQLLLNDRRKLETLGFSLTVEGAFKHHYVAPEDWQVELQQHGQQWQLALSFVADGHKIDVFDLLRQLRAFNQDLTREQLELQHDGRILVLPGALVGSLSDELADLLEQYKSDMPLPLSQIYRLNTLKDALPESAQWHGGEVLQERAINLRSSPVMLDRKSCDVRAELRPYQWLGVCWLQHLATSGFNGLLADDMGLGKTLQTIAHLSLEHKSGRLDAPALIVAPTSLLGNWQSELQRFCPQLSCHVLHGQNRHQFWQQDRQYAVLITSYHLVARDSEYWQSTALSWLILDEAQTIKNARTQLSQAVRALQAQRRLCLSGTPVENHLGELWSLLDFLEPGMLGSQRQFKQYYQKPIQQDGSQQRLEQLLQRVAPFMLRRTKGQVAKDLPAKTVMQRSIAFDDQQQTFYQQLKTEGWQQLSEQLADAENAGQKQILLLTALTRLRQACCDPALLGVQDVPSAKTEYCLQMLEELAAEDRAVLVFSQFTKVLDILANALQKLAIPYLMLTGQSKNRAHSVECFQRGDAPIFLISLKAGGVGLNLTRADTVIHFDPWWNAAAEDQATDRAHRIGQTQPVFVYKLIAQGTIEEKIAGLQQAKASISQHVNRNAQSTGDSFALKLEDLLALWQED